MERGKMSVPAGLRGESKFEVLIDALKLSVYTIRITKNEKVFLPEYRSALTDDMVRAAKNIYTYAWQANNIRVQDHEDFKNRSDLQEKAILECYALLPMIQMAKMVFHLKGKRVKYWSEMTVKVKDELKAWKTSDSKRYKK